MISLELIQMVVEPGVSAQRHLIGERVYQLRYILMLVFPFIEDDRTPPSAVLFDCQRGIRNRHEIPAADDRFPNCFAYKNI
jgi:hypothetical protein